MSGLESRIVTLVNISPSYNVSADTISMFIVRPYVCSNVTRTSMFVVLMY